MNRKKFLTALATIPVSIKIMQLKALSQIVDPLKETPKMPVLFMGHGNPMNAVETNAYTRGWAKMVKDIPTPKAILVISAHWETSGGTKVFTGEKPKMIYDMYGFPKHLYEVNYPSDGSPELAKEINSKIPNIVPTHEWGLDHGAWSVLVKMFPDATIPCFQLSLNKTRDLQWHYDLAKELAFLRRKGVLILSSGNINHNLRYLRIFNQPAPDWALQFDNIVTTSIKNRDHQPLIHYTKLGDFAKISVNSAEHYIPLLYTLALQEKEDEVSYANHDVDGTLLGLGMRCVRVG